MVPHPPRRRSPYPPLGIHHTRPEEGPHTHHEETPYLPRRRSPTAPNKVAKPVRVSRSPRPLRESLNVSPPPIVEILLSVRPLITAPLEHSLSVNPLPGGSSSTPTLTVSSSGFCPSFPLLNEGRREVRIQRAPTECDRFGFFVPLVLCGSHSSRRAPVSRLSGTSSVNPTFGCDTTRRGNDGTWSDT